MSETNNTPALLGEALLGAIRQAIREEIQAVMGGNSHENGKATDILKVFLTVKEAGSLSSLGSSTIRVLIRQRKLRAHKVGRRVIIKRADLEKYLEANPIEALPE